MDSWMKSLKRKPLPEPKVRIRHNLQYVGASLLGKQEYCELKIDFEIKYGVKTTEEMKKGTVIHSAWLPEEEVPMEQLIEEIQKEEAIVSFPVKSTIWGIPIVGRPDAMIFNEGKMKYLLELKTVNVNVEKLWDSEVVQSLVYCYCLDEMGFGDKMEIIIPKVQRELDTKDLKKIICKIIGIENNKECPELAFLLYKVIEQKKVFELEEKTKGQIKIHFFYYDRYLAREWLEYNLQFWIEKRAPRKARYRNQCLICEFRESCQDALIFNDKKNKKN